MSLPGMHASLTLPQTFIISAFESAVNVAKAFSTMAASVKSSMSLRAFSSILPVVGMASVLCSGRAETSSKTISSAD